MYDYLDMDLLEEMKINNLFSLYDQESINEASIAGMKITKVLKKIYKTKNL